MWTFRQLQQALALPPEGRRFLARAWLVAPMVEASLRIFGMRRTATWIDAVPPRRAASDRRASIDVGAKAVRGAYKAHWLRGTCLPQSLVQYLLHRRDGAAARLVVGVRRPLDARESRRRIEAHAWVEAPGAMPSGAEGSGFEPLLSVETPK